MEQETTFLSNRQLFADRLEESGCQDMRVYSEVQLEGIL